MVERAVNFDIRTFHWAQILWDPFQKNPVLKGMIIKIPFRTRSSCLWAVSEYVLASEPIKLLPKNHITFSRGRDQSSLRKEQRNVHQSNRVTPNRIQNIVLLDLNGKKNYNYLWRLHCFTECARLLGEVWMRGEGSENCMVPLTTCISGPKD